MRDAGRGRRRVASANELHARAHVALHRLLRLCAGHAQEVRVVSVFRHTGSVKLLVRPKMAAVILRMRLLQ